MEFCSEQFLLILYSYLQERKKWRNCRMTYKKSKLLTNLDGLFWLNVGRVDTHRLRHIWSQTHMVPGNLVPNLLVPLDKRSPTNPVPLDKWSPKIRCPWTNGPNQFGPPGQMVPRIFPLSRGTGCWDPEIRRPNWMGTICPREPKF